MYRYSIEGIIGKFDVTNPRNVTSRTYEKRNRYDRTHNPKPVFQKIKWQYEAFLAFCRAINNRVKERKLVQCWFQHGKMELTYINCYFPREPSINVLNTCLTDRVEFSSGHLTSYVIYLHIQILSSGKLCKNKVISMLNLAPYNSGMCGSGGVNPRVSNLCTR